MDPVTGQASGIVLPSEDDTDPSAFSPVLRCPTAGHWAVGRNGAYGYNHQYLGDARSVGRDENGKPLHRHYPISPSAIVDKGNTVVLMDSAGTGTEDYRPANRPRSEALGNHSFTVDPPVLPVRGAGGRWGSDSAVPGIGVPDRVSRPHARHRGGCCVLFADGRAQWLPLERLLKSDALWNGTGVPGP